MSQIGWQLVGGEEEERGLLLRAWLDASMRKSSRDQGLSRPHFLMLLPAVHASHPPPLLLTSPLITQPLKAAWPAVDPESL